MEGLRSLLETIDGPRVVAVETNVEDAVRAVRELQPSVLIVDKGLGAANLANWMGLLSAGDKPTAVIVWGASMGESEALRFLQAGAAGVIRKTATLMEVTACVLAVMAGGKWMENGVLRDAGTTTRSGSSALTPRELQVLDLVQRGYKNKEIGVALDIRTGTVKIHLKHIFEKTGIRGRYGLAISGLKERGTLATAG